MGLAGLLQGLSQGIAESRIEDEERKYQEKIQAKRDFAAHIQKLLADPNVKNPIKDQLNNIWGMYVGGDFPGANRQYKALVTGMGLPEVQSGQQAQQPQQKPSSPGMTGSSAINKSGQLQPSWQPAAASYRQTGTGTDVTVTGQDPLATLLGKEPPPQFIGGSGIYEATTPNPEYDRFRELEKLQLQQTLGLEQAAHTTQMDMAAKAFSAQQLFEQGLENAKRNREEAITGGMPVEAADQIYAQALGGGKDLFDNMTKNWAVAVAMKTMDLKDVPEKYRNVVAGQAKWMAENLAIEKTKASRTYGMWEDRNALAQQKAFGQEIGRVMSRTVQKAFTERSGNRSIFEIVQESEPGAADWEQAVQILEARLAEVLQGELGAGPEEAWMAREALFNRNTPFPGMRRWANAIMLREKEGMEAGAFNPAPIVGPQGAGGQQGPTNAQIQEMVEGMKEMLGNL